MTKTILPVEGMSCNHCKMTVEKALKAVAGVSRADVDLSKKTASINYDEAVCSLDKLTQAVVEAGYEVPGQA